MLLASTFSFSTYNAKTADLFSENRQFLSVEWMHSVNALLTNWACCTAWLLGEPGA